jgi:VWFA-related protein
MPASSLRTVARWSVVVLGFTLICVAQNNKSQPSESDRKFISTTELVLVPVVVHDKSGAHVPGLTKDDFQVSEAGKAQNVAVFEEVKASTAPASRSAASNGAYSNMLQQDRSSKRVVVIAIDQVNSAYLDQARARRQLTEHLVEAVGDGALTALVRIHSRGVTVIHDFTEDPQALVEGLKLALAAEKGEVSPTEFNTPLQPMEADGGRATKNDAIKELLDTKNLRSTGIRDFFEKYNEFLHQTVNYADQSNAIELTLDAMEHIAHSLSGMPGRKSLIWLTGAFPLSLNPTSEILKGQGAAYFRRTVQALNDANVAVYPIDVRGVINTAEGLDESYPTQLTVRHRNTDTPEVRAEDPNKLHYEAMRAFASSTGGVPFYNNNNVPVGIRNAIEDSSAYYMLGYYRTEKNTAMQWKAVSVKVRGQGLQVRSRSGYYAGQTSDKTTTAELVNAMDSPWDYTGVPISIQWSGATAADDPHKRKVPFEIMVNAASLDLSRHHLQLQYAAAVKALDGKTINRWGETLEGDINPEQEKQIAGNGITYRNALSLPAGKYLVRFVVRDDVTGHIGSVLAPLDLN